MRRVGLSGDPNHGLTEAVVSWCRTFSVHFRTGRRCQCRSLIPIWECGARQSTATALAPNKTPVALAEQKGSYEDSFSFKWACHV